jgi:hypothetical protein
MTTTWHKGPPPSIGWWPASTGRNPNILRWWNGAQWSRAAPVEFNAKQAEQEANLPTEQQFQDEIEWTDRPADWPERSRT